MKLKIIPILASLFLVGCDNHLGLEKAEKTDIQIKHEAVIEYVCSDDSYRKWEQLAAGLDVLMGTMTSMPDESPLTLIYTATIVNQRAILTSMTSQNAILCDLHRNFIPNSRR